MERTGKEQAETSSMWDDREFWFNECGYENEASILYFRGKDNADISHVVESFARVYSGK